MLSVKKLISVFVSLALCALLAFTVVAAPATPANTLIGDSTILSVLFPADISFVIDPFEVKGRGQVYSEEYAIENYSDEDIIVTIESFYYEFANDMDFQSLDAPFNEEEEESDLKAIYMQADFFNGETLVFSDKETSGDTQFLLKAVEFDDSGALSEECRVAFSFSGGVNPYPVKKWHDGDVKVHMRYFTSQSVPEEIEDKFAEDNSILQVQAEIPFKIGEGAAGSQETKQDTTPELLEPEQPQDISENQQESSEPEQGTQGTSGQGAS